MYEKLNDHILEFERDAIIMNIIDSFFKLFNFIIENKITFENNENKINMLNLKETLFLEEEQIDIKKYTTKVQQDLLQAWKDKAFQEAYKNKSKIQIFDGSFYLLENLKKYNVDFKVEREDILYTRKKTIGVSKLLLDVDLPKKIIFDVGGKNIINNNNMIKIIIIIKIKIKLGQGNERAKWEKIKNFSDYIFFFSSLNDYSKLLYEDNKTNRLIDCLECFKAILKSCPPYTKIILLFTKYDLFSKTLIEFKFSNYFKEFKGFFFFFFLFLIIIIIIKIIKIKIKIKKKIR
jgi:hypothetical protein